MPQGAVHKGKAAAPQHILGRESSSHARRPLLLDCDQGLQAVLKILKKRSKPSDSHRHRIAFAFPKSLLSANPRIVLGIGTNQQPHWQHG